MSKIYDQLREFLDSDAASTLHLDSVMNRFSAEAGYRLSLERLLARWETFVVEVESGYEGSIYDYANDVSVRDLLHVATQEVPPTLASMIATLLAPWDQRFLDATHPLERTVGALSGEHAWSGRVPNRESHELMNDLTGR